MPPTAPPTAPAHTPHRQSPSRWASRLRRPLHRTFLWVCLPQLSAQERGLDHRVKLPPHSEQDPLKGPGLDSMSPDLSKSRFPWSGSQKLGWRNSTRGIPRRGPPPPNSRFCNRRESASRTLRNFNSPFGESPHTSTRCSFRVGRRQSSTHRQS